MSRVVIDHRGGPATTDLLVNGELLTSREIAGEVANFPAATPAESWQTARQAMVLRLVLRQRAVARGIEATPQEDAAGRRETDEDAVLRALIEAEVVVSAPEEAEIVAFHSQTAERFRAPALFEASHILFAAAPGDTVAREAARRRAAEVAGLLAAAPERFAALAAELSACSSGAQGGALGQISQGETAPEFEAALRALSPGEISPPLETRFGVHLVRLARRVDGAVLPLPAVRPRIVAYLAERAQRRAIAAYLDAVMATADVQPVAIAAENEGQRQMREFVTKADDAAWLKVIGDINRSSTETIWSASAS